MGPLNCLVGIVAATMVAFNGVQCNTGYPIFSRVWGCRAGERINASANCCSIRSVQRMAAWVAC